MPSSWFPLCTGPAWAGPFSAASAVSTRAPGRIAPAVIATAPNPAVFRNPRLLAGRASFFVVVLLVVLRVDAANFSSLIRDCLHRLFGRSVGCLDRLFVHSSRGLAK